MKKLIAMTLAIVLVFSLCACGQGNTPSGDQSGGTVPPQGENQENPSPEGENQGTPPEGEGQDTVDPEANKPVDYTVHLNDYILFQHSGYWTSVDGVEKEVNEPRIYFDSKQFYQDHKDKVIGFYTKDDIMDVLQAPEFEGPFCFDYVEGYDNILEDGEVINFKWKFNDDEVAKLKAMLDEKVNFAHEDFAFTVSVVPAEYGNRVTAMLNGAASPVDMDAIQKEGIKLEDFVTIVQDGAHGKGVVEATLDQTLLMDVACQFIVDGYTREDIQLAVGNIYVSPKISGELSNGDRLKITASMNPYFSPDGREIYLSDMLCVPVTNMDTEYTVKGLPEVVPVDLSEHMIYKPFGGSIEDGWSSLVATSYFKLPTGENVKITGRGAKADGSAIQTGDVVTVDFSSSTSAYTKVFGEAFIKSQTVDIKVEYLPYIPMGDNARDVFDNMDQTCSANMEYALGRILQYAMGQDAYEAANITIERVGMMYYYMDKGTEMSGFEGNHYNQLIAIYKIVTSDNPNGFYTYLGYNGDMYVHKEFDKATGDINACVFDINANHVHDDFRYYKNELPAMNSSADGPISFEKNGITYPGHESLEELFVAISKNVVRENKVDHLIVTDGLRDYISEF